MRKRVAEILMTIAKILPFVVMLALVALYLPNKDAVSVDSILRYTPDNLWLAALAVLAAYAVKSLSVFFPLLVLYAAAGLLFPLPAALLVNLSGLLVCVTVPYGIGRFAGKDLVDSLQKKYKKIARINEIKRGSELFFAFFLRIIAVLPGDVVSMVLGASGHDLLEVRRGIPVRAAAGHGGDHRRRLLPVRSHLPGVHRHGGAGGASVGGIFRPLADGQPEKRGFPSGNPILSNNAPFWLENVRIHAAIVCPPFDFVRINARICGKNRAVRVVRGA